MKEAQQVYDDLSEEHWQRDSRSDSDNSAASEQLKAHVVCPQCGGDLRESTIVHCSDCGLILEDAPTTPSEKREFEAELRESRMTTEKRDSTKWGDAATTFKQDFADREDLNNWADHKDRPTSGDGGVTTKADRFTYLFNKYIRGEYHRGLSKQRLLVHLANEYNNRDEWEDARFEEVLAEVERREGVKLVSSSRRRDRERRKQARDLVAEVPVNLSNAEIELIQDLATNHKATRFRSFGGMDGYLLSLLAHCMQTFRGVDPFEASTWLRRLVEERLVDGDTPWVCCESSDNGGAVPDAVTMFKRAVEKWSDLHEEPRDVALTGNEVLPNG